MVQFAFEGLRTAEFRSVARFGARVSLVSQGQPIAWHQDRKHRHRAANVHVRAREYLSEDVLRQRRLEASRAVDKAKKASRQRLDLLGVSTSSERQVHGTFCEAILDPGDHNAPAEKGGRRRGGKGAARRELLSLHKRHFQAALDAELAEESRKSEERLRRNPQVLQAQGWALLNLDAKPEGRLYSDSLLRFSPLGNAALPPHNFHRGDSILVSRRGNRPDDDAVQGVVADISSRCLRAAFSPSEAAHTTGAGFRLDLYSTTVAYERATAALDAFQVPVQPSDPSQMLRRLLLGDTQGMGTLEAVASTMAPVFKGLSAKAIRKAAAGASSARNPAQAAAIRSSIGRTLSLWQGPPGTGKTVTIAAFARAMRAAAGAAGARVLVCAPSNIAVDNLAAGLHREGLDVIRVGSPAKVAAEMREVTLEARMSKHPTGVQARELKEKAASMAGPAQANAFQKAKELERAAARAVLGRADVVVATCVGAGDPFLAEHTFPVCVIDEAAQATEPDAFIPVLKGAQSLLLVGDQQQLPPTVLSPRAGSLGLGVPLFQRLLALGVPPRLLDVQYRMHPGISAFPCTAFYHGRLRDGVSCEDRPGVDGLSWPSPLVPVAFVQCSGAGEQRSAEHEVPDSPSIFNTDEARAALAVVRTLAARVSGRLSVGVISPYRAQVHLIKAQLGQLPRADDLDVHVATVDGFQGQERDLIIFSAVRSNTESKLGFVADHRRMNVALTRAKRGLLVIGDSRTLRRDRNWDRWLAWSAAAHVQCTLEALLAP